MNEAANRIGEMLLQTEAIAFYKEKPFVFVSGRISPVYIDCRRLLSFPEVRETIITEMARKAETEIGLDKIDVVAGGETAGIPYAALVAQKLKKPMIYIRKQPKGYGGTKQIEGILEANRRVLLVEDLITDGLSKLRFNIGVRGAGSTITHSLCVFEYGSDSLDLHEGKKNLAEHGIESYALVNWDHVLNAGLSKKYFTEEAGKQILDFLKDPENWGRRMGFV
jgi:orotate phosphoribosyltransferase